MGSRSLAGENTWRPVRQSMGAFVQRDNARDNPWEHFTDHIVHEIHHGACRSVADAVLNTNKPIAYIPHR